MSSATVVLPAPDAPVSMMKVPSFVVLQPRYVRMMAFLAFTNCGVSTIKDPMRATRSSSGIWVKRSLWDPACGVASVALWMVLKACVSLR